MGSPKISVWKCCLALSVLRAVYGQVAIETRVKTPAPVAARPPSSLRIDTSLVLVPVAVCDSKNRPVTGLEKEHFRVFDDSVEQTVTHFAMEDEAVAVGLVFDISGSMANKLRLSRKAVAAFL